MAKVTTLEEADSTFDIQFWQKIGDKGIYEAMWELVTQVPTIKGKPNESQSRLQRSVTRIKQNPL